MRTKKKKKKTRLPVKRSWLCIGVEWECVFHVSINECYVYIIFEPNSLVKSNITLI